MSVRAKGGMYCPACQKPVMAIRSGHAVRNTVGAAATLGLSLKTERWRCPDCGGVAYGAATGPKTVKEAERGEAWAAIALVAAIALGIATSSVIVGLVVLVAVLVIGAFRDVKTGGAPEGRHGGQYRCEKNDHLLTAKHESCPIDGSTVHRI